MVERLESAGGQIDGPKVPPRPGRVLIADDDPLVRETLRELLDGYGFEVVGEAATGVEAVRLAGERGPEVILMDVIAVRKGGRGEARPPLAWRGRLRARHHPAAVGRPVEAAVGAVGLVEGPGAHRDPHGPLRVRR